MAGRQAQGAWQCGRRLTTSELLQIQEVVELFPRLSPHELLKTICEHLNWRTASGGYKVDACRKLLEKMAVRGDVALPPKRACSKRQERQDRPASVPTPAPTESLTGKLRTCLPVRVVPLTDKEEVARCAVDVEHYHVLGYRKPIGCFAHYAIESARGRLGYLVLAGAAKQIGVRDRWIGWDDAHRLRNLPYVVNNSRFLLFPWVRIRYGASHVLSQMARRLAEDWAARWSYRPVLLETFVDPSRYDGTCYRAAGWIELGRTTGVGLCRPGRAYRTTAKKIFVRPLTEAFRVWLCRHHAPGRAAV